jgi:hypothetical protein
MGNPFDNIMDDLRKESEKHGKKIAVATIGPGLSAAITNPKTKADIIIVHDNDVIDLSRQFEIDGVVYAPVPEKPKKSRRPGIFELATLALAFPSYTTGATQYARKRPVVNIIEEYKLILQKKSNLSRNDRDWVEFTFHRMYRIVE